MIDPFKGCDPRDDDNWSIGAMFCWVMFGLIALGGVAYCWHMAADVLPQRAYELGRTIAAMRR